LNIVGLAGRREAYSACRAVEEDRPEMFLERIDLPLSKRLLHLLFGPL
jgi:hypothetical protein